MATLRVFVSSTAYDLAVLRSALKSFIEGLGFEPILSEYSDVLYDPREHTHTSCIAEVRNCDIVLLLVGARFGGEAIPSVVSSLGLRQLEDIATINDEHKFSVTQAESITAFDQGIPVFAFVDVGVLHDYRVYSLNRGTKITYPTMTQPQAAEYIFDFINFLQNRSYGNAVIPFARIEDVILHLRKQWAALFQRLLRETRDQREEGRRIDRLAEQFDDLKTALLATAGDGDARRIARGAVRYRRLIDFIKGIPALGDLRQYAVESELEWSAFLRDYADVREVRSVSRNDRAVFPYTMLIKGDGSAYLARLNATGITRISQDWNDFKFEPTPLRTVLYDTLTEQDTHSASSMTRLLTKEETAEFLERHIGNQDED